MRHEPCDDLVAQSMLDRETAAFPPLLRGRINLRRGFDAATIDRATELLVLRWPRLAARIVLEDGMWTWVYPDHESRASRDAAVRAIRGAAPEARLVDLALDPKEAPLWRVRYQASSTGSTLDLVAHHALVDGVGAGILQREFLAAIAAVEAGHDRLPHTAPPERRARRQRVGVATLARLFAQAARRWWVAKFDPPQRLIADDTSPRNLALRTLSDDAMATIRPTLRSSPGTTVNDVLLAAFHRALAGENAPESKGRISILVPVDLRALLGPAEPFGNCVAAFRSDSHGVDRATLDRAIATVSRASSSVRTDRLASTGHLLRQLLSLPMIQRRQAERRRAGKFPVLAAASQPSAVMTYPGTLRFAAETDDWVDAVFGAPPVAWPTSYGLGVVKHRGAFHLALHGMASEERLNAVLDEMGADLLRAELGGSASG